MERESLVFTIMLRNYSFANEFLSSVLVRSKLIVGILPGNGGRVFL
jgi:hypothetical protein